MDPLIDLLRAMNLTSGVFLRAEFTAPWCVTTRIEPQEGDALLARPAHVIGYHYVTEGQCLLEVEGQRPVTVRAGEVVLLPRNDSHRLGSALSLKSVNAGRLIQPSSDGLIHITYGGGGEPTRLLCGFLGTSTPDPPIVRVLPAALTIGVDGQASAWIESSLRFAADEVARTRSGLPTVVARLAELLFLEAVSRHVASLPAEHRGWLTGLRDPVVGRALALLHGAEPYRWTVTALARESGASRSVFAERFTDLIGESPIRYLARHRLRRAAQRLREGQDPVASVAFEVGYESEAAFSRAFKREYGTSPLVWRRSAPEAH